MSGTHGASSRRSTRQRQRNTRSLKVIAGAVPVVLVGAGLALVVAKGGVQATLDASASTCANPTHVRVSTTEDFLPVLRKVAQGVEDASAGEANCPAYDVTADAPSTEVSRIAGDGNDRPDVWVPDSSIWVARANAQLAGDTLPEPVTVAQSPLVVAVPASRAAHYAGAGVPSWQQLLGGDVPAQMSDPGASTTGLLALTTVRSALGTSPEVQQAVGAAMIRLSRTFASNTDELFARAASEKAAAPGFPASEQQVMRYDAGHPEALLMPVIPTPGTGRLDYPFVSLPSRRPGVAKAVLALRNALTSDTGQRAVQAAGFRTADGKGGPTPTPGVNTPAVTLLPQPTLKDVDAALSTWSSVSTEMRMLAVIDVSGSMTEQFGGLTRMAVAQGATDTALRFFPPRSQVGLWVFSTDKDGPGKDWKQLVPLGQLDAPEGSATHRDALLKATAGLGSWIGGNTGLYDTILAAYEQVRQNWDPSRINSVVLLTDGQNDDKQGLNLDQLMARLKAESDPARPVPVITIGIGPDVDASVLDEISRATGGKSYLAQKPDDIRKVFVEALLQRNCRPNC